MRDVDDDAVGAGPFHLEIGMAAGRHRRIDMVLGGQPPAMRALELLARLVEIVDLEPEMVNTREMRAVRAHVGRFLALGVEDRHVDVAVGQKDRAVGAAPQFLEAERRFVELGDFRRLLRRQRDVLDACHGLLPYSVRCCDTLAFSCIARQTRSGVAGISMWLTPKSESASTIALMTTPRAGVVPPSPAGRMPSGWVGDGTSESSVAKNGTVSARGIV